LGTIEEEEPVVDDSLPRSAMGLEMPEVDGILQTPHPIFGGLDEWADSFSFKIQGECTDVMEPDAEREMMEERCSDDIPEMTAHVKAVGTSFAMAFEVPSIGTTPSTVLLESSYSSNNQLSASIETDSSGNSNYIVETTFDCYDMLFCDPSATSGSIKQSATKMSYSSLLEPPPKDASQFTSESAPPPEFFLFTQFAVVHDLDKLDLTGEFSEILYFKDSQDADFNIEIRFSNTNEDETHFFSYDSNTVYNPMIFGYVNPLNWVSNDVEVLGIEVTQAIQTENMDMPLISGKPSLARVYVDSGTSSDVEVEVRLRACLIIICSQPLTSTHTAPSSIDRDDFGDSANFILPSFWTESPLINLVADAYIIPGDEVYDPNLDDNRFSGFYEFHETMDFDVWAIRIQQDVSGDSALEEPSQAMIDSLMLMTEQLFPVDNLNTINFYLDGDMTDCQDAAGENDLTLCANILQGATLTKINQYQELLDSGTTEYVPPLPDQVFGIFPANAGVSGVANAAWGGEDPSLVSVGTARSGGCGHRDLCAAHEMTHNLGPYCFDNTGDDDCGDLADESWGAHLSQTGDPDTDSCGAGGFDRVWNAQYGSNANAYNIKDLGWNSFDDSPETDLDALIDSGMPDYMSYCNLGEPGWTIPNAPEDTDINQWISTDRWEYLFDKFSNWDEGDPITPYQDDMGWPGRQTMGNNSNPTNFRIISGVINEDRSARLLPSWQEDGGVSAAFKSNYGSTTDDFEYILYMRDANGNNIEKIFITPHYHDSEHRNVSHSFTYFVEDNDQIKYIELYDARQNMTVTSIYSQNTPISPTVTVDKTSYNRGDEIKATWTPIAGMYYKVQYSWNQDLWTDASVWIRDSSYSFPINNLPSSDKGIVRVIATNGFDTVSEESGLFSIPNQPAEVEFKVNGGGVSFNTALPQPHADESSRGEMTKMNTNPKIMMNQLSSISFEPRIIDYDWEDLNEFGCALELTHNGEMIWSQGSQTSTNEIKRSNKVKTLQFSDAMQGWTQSNSNECVVENDQFASISFPNSDLMGAEMYPGDYTFTFRYVDNRGAITTQSVDFEIVTPQWAPMPQEIIEYQESLVRGDDNKNNPPGENKGCINYDDTNGNGAYDIGEPCWDNLSELERLLENFKAEACKYENGEAGALTQEELDNYANELGLSDEDLKMINLDDCR